MTTNTTQPVQPNIIDGVHMYTPTETARKLGVSRQKLMSMVAAGKIRDPEHHYGRSWFSDGHIDRYYRDLARHAK